MCTNNCEYTYNTIHPPTPHPPTHPLPHPHPHTQAQVVLVQEYSDLSYELVGSVEQQTQRLRVLPRGYVTDRSTGRRVSTRNVEFW